MSLSSVERTEEQTRTHLVDEQRRAPVLRNVEDVAQPLLEDVGLHAEAAGAYGVERDAESLGDGLGRERLAGAGRAVERDDLRGFA